MKKLSLIMALLALGLFGVHPAAAFSTEQSTQNPDGTAKFADPDEQMPGLVVSPTQGGNSNGALSFGAPSVNLPSPADTSSGAQAFDRAFAHQQDGK